MKGGATRRSVLAAALTAPVLAAGGCRAAAGATPAAAQASDVAILRAAIAAKRNMIGLYTATRAANPALAGRLDPLLTDNTAHLAELQRRLIEPAHRSSPRSGGRADRHPATPPSPAAGPRAALAALQSAEHTAAAVHVGQLRTVTPSLAQLLASIAACEASHVAALATGGLVP